MVGWGAAPPTPPTVCPHTLHDEQSVTLTLHSFSYPLTLSHDPSILSLTHSLNLTMLENLLAEVTTRRNREAAMKSRVDSEIRAFMDTGLSMYLPA